MPETPSAPAGLDQFESDGSTVLPVGATATALPVVLAATLNDADPNDMVRLEAEVRAVGTAFTGAPTDSSAFVPAGTQVSLSLTDLNDDARYHWRARAVDARGQASPWQSFGGNAEGEDDFVTFVPQPPIASTALNQVRLDSTTAIAIGATTPEAGIVVSGVISDPDPGATLQLEVEVKPVGAAFDGTNTVMSATVESGQTARARVTPLDDDREYHWRARAIDQMAMSGPWAEFGGNASGANDVAVDVPAVSLEFRVEPSMPSSGAPMFPALEVRAVEASGTTDTAFVAERA